MTDPIVQEPETVPYVAPTYYNLYADPAFDLDDALAGQVTASVSEGVPAVDALPAPVPPAVPVAAPVAATPIVPVPSQADFSADNNQQGV